MTKTFAALAAAAIVASAGAAAARDQIRVVGSSTVFPYSQAVAEEFARATGRPSPVVESTGTGGGFQVFCGGVGQAHPDVTGASRAIRKSEFDLCAQNGVTDISEALIGFDGLTVAYSKASPHKWNLTKAQLYLALASEVPVDGNWVANPYRRWSEIDALLPDIPISVMGPPPTSGTRDAWVDLAMHAGCRELPFVKSGGFDSKWVNENCSRMRQDGPFIEAGENDNLIVQRLVADPNTLGIFGYSFKYENADRLNAVAVNGVEPTFDTIADGSYGIARPIFIYIKNAHRGVIPGLDEFIEEYVSDEALGRGGYLAERGMTPMPPAKLKEVQETVRNAVSMSAPSS